MLKRLVLVACCAVVPFTAFAEEAIVPDTAQQAMPAATKVVKKATKAAPVKHKKSTHKK